MAKCKNCNNLYNLSNEDDEIVGKWCPKINDSPDIELERECEHYKCITNADRIRSMTDEELAELLRRTIAETGDNLFLCKEYETTEYCLGYSCANCKAYLVWLQSEVE